ncbi:MAG: 30S ribosomal protein S4 [bacterium]
MGKDLYPVCKRCRREGEKLFLKGERCQSPKCPMIKRNYPPGLHGAKGRTRLTAYGRQLREKQKTKRIYGLLEKQFANYYEKAKRQKGNTSETLARFLEKRLDNVVYRLGFAVSRRLAKQLVSHGHFLVNQKKVNISSYQAKVGDIIELRAKSGNSAYFKNLKENINPPTMPSWLTLDKENLTGKITSQPQLADWPKNIDLTLVIEYYSR